MKNDNLNRSKSMKKFLVCSILGFICFLMPIPDSGSWNIPINYVTTRLEGLVGNAGLTILFVEFVIALLGSVIVTLFLKDKFTKDTFIGKIFNCGPVDLTCRILGSLLFFMYYFKIGPDLFLGPDVGGSLEGLLLTVGVGLGLALILMPLLTDFGLMEFLGTLFNGGMRKIWKLPGRAAVDLLSSWFGMVQVGLLISEKQYLNGFYTKREVSIIATCFTATGVGFWIVCGQEIGLADYILPFFGGIILVGFASAAVMARIPPLSIMPDEFYVINENNVDIIEAEKAKGKTNFQIAVDYACKTAANARNFKTLLADSILDICKLVAGLLPSVMLIGAIGLMIANGTSIFYYLGKPFELVWNLCQLPEGEIAGSALISGLADMFLPIIIGGGAISLRAKFVIGVVGMVQIIYASEVISFIAASKIPVKIWEMVVIFFEKTIIAIPLAALTAVLFGIPV